MATVHNCAACGKWLPADTKPLWEDNYYCLVHLRPAVAASDMLEALMLHIAVIDAGATIVGGYDYQDRMRKAIQHAEACGIKARED